MMRKITNTLAIAAILMATWFVMPASVQSTIANNAADMVGKIVMVADSTTGRTVTNLFTFNRGAAVPFAVNASSLKVTNLDADKLDGLDSTAYIIKATDLVWTSYAFNAANFTATTGSWTLTSGDVARNSYLIIGKMIFWHFAINTSTVTATPSSLKILIPSGTFASTINFVACAYANDNGTIKASYASPSDATHIALAHTDGTNWATNVDSTYIYCAIFMELA